MIHDRKLSQTKMVCTIGPASASREVLTQLMDEGMNIARLNFSHENHEVQKQRIDLIRQLALEKNKNIAILQDLQGPKIRTGKLKSGFMELVKNKEYIIKYGVEQEGEEIPIDYAGLASDVHTGASILLDDGLMEMKVTALTSEGVRCRIIHGGKLKSRKGVNFPDTALSIPATTEKDLKDLFFGVSQGVDYIALSFVQKAEDVSNLQKRIKSLGSNIPVIAKIEMSKAIENLEEITKQADGIMVARGDLGVECGFSRVSYLQKRIITCAQKYQKPVIVATQMLESMQKNTQPTKAEINDIANAVFDGVDATMLSGESAAGNHPILSVKTMRAILDSTENYTRLKKPEPPTDGEHSGRVSQVQAHTAVELAQKTKANAIICLTLTGISAQDIARYRPNCPIFALSPSLEVIRKLALIRNVHPIHNTEFFDTDLALSEVVPRLEKRGLLKKDQLVVITAGIPMTEMLPTNMVKLQKVE